MTWTPPRHWQPSGNLGSRGAQGIGSPPPFDPPPHIVLGEGIAFVIQQLERILDELRRLREDGDEPTEG